MHSLKGLSELSINRDEGEILAAVSDDNNPLASRSPQTSNSIQNTSLNTNFYLCYNFLKYVFFENRMSTICSKYNWKSYSSDVKSKGTLDRNENRELQRNRCITYAIYVLQRESHATDVRVVIILMIINQFR